MELPQTLVDSIIHFSNEQRCESILQEVRWHDGEVTCPHCNSTNVHYLANQKRWKCRNNHPRRQFSIRTSTAFEESPIPLSKWYICLYLLVNCRNGVSSHEIGRFLGIRQGTAWFMLQRLRNALVDPHRRKLKGEVQADETFVGGKFARMNAQRRYQARQRDNKVIVFGILERTGRSGPR